MEIVLKVFAFSMFVEPSSDYSQRCHLLLLGWDYRSGVSQISGASSDDSKGSYTYSFYTSIFLVFLLSGLKVLSDPNYFLTFDYSRRLLPTTEVTCVVNLTHELCQSQVSNFNGIFHP